MKRLICGILLLSIAAVAASDLRESQRREVSAKRKLQECKGLTDLALEFLRTNSLEVACRSFTQDIRWRRGEIEIFVFSDDGICYAFGQDHRYIWHDFQTKKTLAQNDFIASMLQVSKNGNGLVSFIWNNGYMQAYVGSIAKEGKVYLVGAGFYPESGKYVVEQLINSAVEYSAANSLTSLFERINNPVGIFVRGDIYLIVYDMHGFCVAHGRSLELIGQNLINDMSNDGKYIVRDYIKIAKSDEGGGWYEYQSRLGGVPRANYVRRLTTAEGKQYVLVCGYYPTLNESDVRSVVTRAVSYMRTHGSEQAFAIFSQPIGPFAYGGITLFVYDLQGKIVADMANPAFVGQNLMNSVDADGRFVTKVIIDQAKKFTSGWVSFNLKNGYNMMYIQKVKLPDGEYVVGAAFYPIGKEVTVRFMVEKAVRYIEQVGADTAFDVFASGSSEFLRGEVQIDVVTPDGVILVQGVNRTTTWTTDSSEIDEKGVPIIKKIAATAGSGGGWVTHMRNGATRRVYAKQVSVELPISKHAVQLMLTNDIPKPVTKNYVVSASYYL